jgi:hypothetical protein
MLYGPCLLIVKFMSIIPTSARCLQDGVEPRSVVGLDMRRALQVVPEPRPGVTDRVAYSAVKSFSLSCCALINASLKRFASGPRVRCMTGCEW